MQAQRQDPAVESTGNAVIKPQSALREKCLRPGDADEAAEQAIANAEQALQQLSVNFDEWMANESAQLGEARDTAKAAAFSEAALTGLFQAAHNLKGQATTLGYPFADEICASLCRLIDKLPEKATLPLILVDQHVDAVRALVREGAKGNDNPKASVLAKRLRDVTNDFLQQVAA
ncbi:MAG: Hpt domain-containing protein [Hyphomicrobiaceae bacterium]|nr:Hpt domain-containing protein [Hyphomicrobiaceae bacterium]